MISNEGRHGESREYHPPRGHLSQQPPRPADEVAATVEVEIENKLFTLSRRKNHAGEFYRMMEEHRNGKRNMICIPATGIAEFMAAFQRVVQAK